MARIAVGEIDDRFSIWMQSRKAGRIIPEVMSP